jgi:hypothetical protein
MKKTQLSIKSSLSAAEQTPVLIDNAILSKLSWINENHSNKSMVEDVLNRHVADYEEKAGKAVNEISINDVIDKLV